MKTKAVALPHKTTPLTSMFEAQDADKIHLNYGSESSIISSNYQKLSMTDESENMRTILERVSSLSNPPSPGALYAGPNEITETVAASLEEKLFNATASAKILTSQVAMYLDREWRDKLFHQLDSIHDPDEWEEEDKPLQKASFATFLKAIFQLRPQKKPGLGLSYNGWLIAAWTAGRDRLTIEFLPEDRVRWVISRYPEGEFEQFAGQTSVSRLTDSLSGQHPEEWMCL